MGGEQNPTLLLRRINNGKTPWRLKNHHKNYRNNHKRDGGHNHRHNKYNKKHKPVGARNSRHHNNNSNKHSTDGVHRRFQQRVQGEDGAHRPGPLRAAAGALRL